MPVFAANGETLSYDKEGSGPAVAFIHGLGSSAHMWAAQTESLKGRYTVIAVDCRGHGGSSGNGEISVEAAAEDLKAVLDHLGVTECHLVGSSSGGLVALVFNARFPGRVRSLVLAGTSVKPTEADVRRVEASREAIAYVSMQEFGMQYAAETLLPTTDLSVQDDLAAVISRIHPKAYNQAMASAMLGDFTSTLAAVTAPTLILIGESDTPAAKEAAEFVAQNIATATVERLEGAGHLGNLDNPNGFNAAVVRFLDRVSAS